MHISNVNTTQITSYSVITGTVRRRDRVQFIIVPSVRSSQIKRNTKQRVKQREYQRYVRTVTAFAPNASQPTKPYQSRALIMSALSQSPHRSLGAWPSSVIDNAPPTEPFTRSLRFPLFTLCLTLHLLLGMQDRRHL